MKRFTCGAGDGMFEDENGYYMSVEDHNHALNLLKCMLSKRAEETETQQKISQTPELRARYSTLMYSIGLIESIEIIIKNYE